MSVVVLEGSLEYETDRALLIDFGTSSGKTWVPKSVIEVESVPNELNITEFSVQEWFAVKEGLI